MIEIINKYKNIIEVFIRYIKEFKDYYKMEIKRRRIIAITEVMNMRYHIGEIVHKNADYYNLVPFLPEELKIIDKYALTMLNDNELFFELNTLDMKNKLMLL